MQSYYSCQSGRSMVEILGVLAVIGVLSVGGIAAYSKAMEKINTDQLIVDISTTARKIKNLYADQKSYEDLDQQVYTLNLVAGAHKIEGMNKKLLHIFNGEVFVKSIALNKGFVMVYNGLTEKACATLASTDWGNGSTGLKYLVVSPTGIIPPRGYPSNLDTKPRTFRFRPPKPPRIAIATLFTNAALPGSTNKHKNVNIFFLTGRRQPFSSCFYVSNAA